ncbi:unnamed protein product [Lactuca virosa]|uniref:Uncharacterized protein n=1 Tax=Lactuca virosa TaxID=75947 RepID=A0AAU9MP83_9ASTR|nr:unnamed protein product [Lactuca virosa]
MAATQHNFDEVTTNEEEISQQTMKILHTNLHLIPSLDVYPNELQLIVQILNNYVLSFALSGTFSILIQWLSLVASMVVFNKSTKVVTFQLLSFKTKKLTKK